MVMGCWCIWQVMVALKGGVDKLAGGQEDAFMQGKSLANEAFEILNAVLMNPESELMQWMAMGVVVLFAAFGLKLCLNFMNAGFPSFFGALVAVVVGAVAMLSAAAFGSMLLGDLGQGLAGIIGVRAVSALFGLALVGAPLAAFLCRSKYMSALGSWFLSLVLGFVGLVAFNAATSGFKSAENVVDRAVERQERLEGEVGN